MNIEDLPNPLQLDRSVPLVDAIFRVIEGTGTELEAARILLDAEELWGVKFSSTSSRPPVIPVPNEMYGELVQGRMEDFLSATHLVVGSSEYSHLNIIIAGNYNYEWTHREWGHTLANWANKTSWLGSTSWNYLDFYGGLNDRVIKNYNAWCKTLMKVISTKTDLEFQFSPE